jgi:hypothetical protein
MRRGRREAVVTDKAVEIIERGDPAEILSMGLRARLAAEDGRYCECEQPILHGPDLMCGRCLLENRDQIEEATRRIREPHAFEPGALDGRMCSVCSGWEDDARHRFRGDVSDFRPPRPPFQPGNGHAVRHGVHASADKLDADPRSDEIEAAMVERFPWLAEAAFLDARVALRRTLVRIERARAWLDEHGDFDPESGKVRDVARLLVTLERLARDQRNDLGMSPAAAAKLSRNVFGARRDQATLEAHLAEGRRIRLEAEARLGLTDGQETPQEASDGVEPAPDDSPAADEDDEKRDLST